MSDIFSRRLTLLGLVPRAPAKVGTRTLLTALSKANHPASLRMVQRDLAAMSEMFEDLDNDGNADQPGWFWARDSQGIHLPGPNETMAVGLALVEPLLGTLMPPVVARTLERWLGAGGTYGADQEWKRRIRVVPRTQPLLAADIDPGALRLVCQALLRRRQIRIRYQPRVRTEEASYDLHPLALILRDQVVYLVATVWEYKDPRHFALHRFRQCELLQEPCVDPEGFDLDVYLSTGVLYWAKHAETRIALVFEMTAAAAAHLYETPLSQDQTIQELADARVTVRATVQDTQQLRWWLLGFGDQVVVREPVALHEELKSVLTRAVAGYTKAGS